MFNWSRMDVKFDYATQDGIVQPRTCSAVRIIEVGLARSADPQAANTPPADGVVTA
jgi:hypothetical protein